MKTGTTTKDGGTMKKGSRVRIKTEWAESPAESEIIYTVTEEPNLQGLIQITPLPEFMPGMYILPTETIEQRMVEVI